MDTIMFGEKTLHQNPSVLTKVHRKRLYLLLMDMAETLPDGRKAVSQISMQNLNTTKEDAIENWLIAALIANGFKEHAWASFWVQDKRGRMSSEVNDTARNRDIIPRIRTYFERGGFKLDDLTALQQAYFFHVLSSKGFWKQYRRHGKDVYVNRDAMGQPQPVNSNENVSLWRKTWRSAKAQRP